MLIFGYLTIRQKLTNFFQKLWLFLVTFKSDTRVLLFTLTKTNTIFKLVNRVKMLNLIESLKKRKIISKMRLRWKRWTKNNYKNKLITDEKKINYFLFAVNDSFVGK